jgi:hypothetical protein
MKQFCYGLALFGVLFLVLFVVFDNIIPLYLLAVIAALFELFLYICFALCMTHAKIIDDRTVTPV